MQVGEKINVEKIVCREVDANYILKILKNNMSIFWSWGSNKFVSLMGKGLRFTVNGNLFKGHIYIVLNGSDLFDVYYCSNRGNIKDIHRDIFFEDLTERIDNKIEKINTYTF